MKIDYNVKENLEAEVSINIVPEDYELIVSGSLKSLKSKVNVPGFRPGMVPVGMVKKLYGKAVLSDEIGKITTNALFDYLEANKINYLGQPLPNIEKNEAIDWDNQKEFIFYYDLGLSPEFEINLDLGSLTSYKIEVDDIVLEKEIKKLLERNGRSINPESVQEGDFVMGNAIQLDESNDAVEGGLNKSIYVFMDKIPSEDLKNTLLGAQVGDGFKLDVRNFYKDAVTAGVYLGLKSEEVEGLTGNFNFEITTINRMIPAQMDQEFYDKIFGEGKVSGEDEFREKLREFLKNDLQIESNSTLLKDIRDTMIENNNFELPDQFLKRWLTVKNQDNEKVNLEEIIADYEENKKFIRWEILRNKLVDKYAINVEEPELMEAAKIDVINRVTKMGYQLPEERIEEFAKTLISNQEESEKLVSNILENKVLLKIKEDVNVVESSIGYDEFISKMQDSEKPIGV